MITTRADQLVFALKKNKETVFSVISCTLSPEQARKEFDTDSGKAEGPSFTVWTENFVYFPVIVNNVEWVASVPRNPNGVATEHIGGQ